MSSQLPTPPFDAARLHGDVTSPQVGLLREADWLPKVGHAERRQMVRDGTLTAEGRINDDAVINPDPSRRHGLSVSLSTLSHGRVKTLGLVEGCQAPGQALDGFDGQNTSTSSLPALPSDALWRWDTATQPHIGLLKIKDWMPGLSTEEVKALEVTGFLTPDRRINDHVVLQSAEGKSIGLSVSGNPLARPGPPPYTSWQRVTRRDRLWVASAAKLLEGDWCLIADPSPNDGQHHVVALTPCDDTGTPPCPTSVFYVQGTGSRPQATKPWPAWKTALTSWEGVKRRDRLWVASASEIGGDWSLVADPSRSDPGHHVLTLTKAKTAGEVRAELDALFAPLTSFDQASVPS